MPPRRDGVWRSYTNVILANGTVLMPTFADVDPSLREQAMALYARLLPGWKVVGINCDRLAKAHGLLRCISLNVPGFVSVASVSGGTGRDPQARSGGAAGTVTSRLP